jgi:uroporphyrinogen-III synthase
MIETDCPIGDDSVFEDLKISKDDYPKVPTTW